MVHILRALNGASGVAMILAGILLARQPWIEIAQPPGSDAFRLIQFHLLLTGAISLWGASASRPGSLIASLSLLIIIANAVLAFHALTAGDPSLLWPAVFVVASVINYVWLIVAERSPEIDEVSASSAAGGQNEEETLVPPNFGAPTAGAYLSAGFAKTLFVAVQIGLSIAVFFCGVVYVELLRAVIFDGANIDFSALLKRVSEAVSGYALIELALYIAIPVVVFAVFFAIEAALNIVQGQSDAARAADFGRELSREERIYIRDSLPVLLDYVAGRKYAPIWRVVFVIGTAGLIASFILVPLAVIGAEALASEKLQATRGVGDEVLFYSGALYAGGAIGGFFVGALLFCSVFQVLGARNGELAEYLYVKAGWSSAASQPRTPDQFIWALTRHVRRRLLDGAEPFDPQKFLYAAFRERESLIYKSTAWSIALATVLAAADLARYEVVDERGVAYSRYFQFASQRVEFAELDRVELRCVLFGPNDEGEINLGVDYILVKNGKFRIDLLDEAAEEETDRLTRIEALDAKLLFLGVPMTLAENAGLLQGKRSSFVPTCAEEIEKRHSPEVAVRLIRLLHVDELAPRSHGESPAAT